MNPIQQKPLEFSHSFRNDRSVIVNVKVNESLAGGVMEQRAEILMSSDYYPFGMTIGETHVESEGYRYGFQAQEEDDELWGGAVSYKYHVEDPRLGRFFSVDPLASKYPHYTPYSFSGNKLIAYRELEGLEEISMHQSWETVNGEELVMTSDRSNGGNQQGLGYEGVYHSQTYEDEFYDSYFPPIEVVGASNEFADASDESNAQIDNVMQVLEDPLKHYVGAYGEFEFEGVISGASYGLLFTRDGVDGYTVEKVMEALQGKTTIRTELASVGLGYGQIFYTGDARELTLTDFEGVSSSFDISATILVADIGVSVAWAELENGEMIIFVGKQASVGVASPAVSIGYSNSAETTTYEFD